MMYGLALMGEGSGFGVESLRGLGVQDFRNLLE
jgi:hypothetical protein